MKDDPHSKFIRAKKGLPDNWRVYLWESTEKGIKVTGALVRPASPEFEPTFGRDFDWIKPLQMKRSMTMPYEKYRALFVGATP